MAHVTYVSMKMKFIRTSTHWFHFIGAPSIVLEHVISANCFPHVYIHTYLHTLSLSWQQINVCMCTRKMLGDSRDRRKQRESIAIGLFSLGIYTQIHVYICNIPNTRTLDIFQIALGEFTLNDQVIPYRIGTSLYLSVCGSFACGIYHVRVIPQLGNVRCILQQFLFSPRWQKRDTTVK